MEILINKWKDFTAYKKLKKLWNEYRKVSHLKLKLPVNSKKPKFFFLLGIKKRL